MEIWQTSEAQEWNPEDLEQAAEVLCNDGIVAFPTETVYGLGGNAFHQRAVLKIFEAKQRPADNPLIVHIADVSQLPQVMDEEAILPEAAKTAMHQFWPGPLTLLLPASKSLAQGVHPHLRNVGVRIPRHPVALELLRKAGCPVAAPSANKSGKPSPTTADDVIEDMQGIIDGVVDGGACSVGLESTVVEIFDDHAVIYRPGQVTREALEEALQIPVVYSENLAVTSSDESPRSPGMKYRHYAPEAKVHVWHGDSAHVLVEMMKFIDDYDGEDIAVISERDFTGRVKSWKPPAGESYTGALSRELYRLLREFDRHGVAHILIQGVPATGVGAALMNRLEKAAEGRVDAV